MSWDKALGAIATGGLSLAGPTLNAATGATSAAKQSQKYALQSAAINNMYQKEFAQNAHQWEVADLKAAGLNPILSAGGSGTGASGGGVNSATEQSSGYLPTELLGTAINMYQGITSAKNTQAKTNETNEDIKTKKIDNKYKELGTVLDILQKKEQLNLTKDTIKNLQTKTEQILKEIKVIEGGSLAKTIGTNVYDEGKDLLGEFVDIWQRNRKKYKEKHPEYNGM